FVDIGPAEGMVHVSELAEYRPHHPSEIVLRGDEVQVKVLKVNRAKRRIELSMRQALYPS
ncbi:MAG: S1 RNA-binding domain-containing protein, partial [Acidimicrobiales bacterium]|nr:S1 RNA-binding domain-containing protein [Acidimicrobiales bacterium]